MRGRKGKNMTKLKFGEKELQIKFGYEATVKSGIIKKVAKVYAMLDDYFDGEDADVQALYNALLTELLENGFLSKLLKAEQKEAEKKTPRKK